MLGANVVGGYVAGPRELLVADDQLFRTGFQIHMRNSAPGRRHVVKKAGANARVAVTRPAVDLAGDH